MCLRIMQNVYSLGSYQAKNKLKILKFKLLFKFNKFAKLNSLNNYKILFIFNIFFDKISKYESKFHNIF